MNPIAHGELRLVDLAQFLAERPGDRAAAAASSACSGAAPSASSAEPSSAVGPGVSASFLSAAPPSAVGLNAPASASSVAPSAFGLSASAQVPTVAIANAVPLVAVRRQAGKAPSSSSSAAAAAAPRHHGAKLDALCRRLLLLPRDEKALVATSWGALRGLASRALTEYGISHAVVDPDDGPDAVASALSSFKRSSALECRALILSAATDCAGLTLTIANHIFCLDPVLSPAVMAQLAGRIGEDVRALVAPHFFNGALSQGALSRLPRARSLRTDIAPSFLPRARSFLPRARSQRPLRAFTRYPTTPHAPPLPSSSSTPRSDTHVFHIRSRGGRLHRGGSGAPARPPLSWRRLSWGAGHTAAGCQRSRHACEHKRGRSRGGGPAHGRLS